MQRFKRLFWTALALAFLGVSWLWEVLHPVIRRLVDWIPLEGLKRRVAAFMDQLGPYPTLAVFLVPLIALEPGKFIAVWLFAKGQWLAGGVTYIVTDILKLGFVAFIFKTSREKLLSIGWFARMHGWFVFAHDWAHAQVAPWKAAIRKALQEAGLLTGKGRVWSKVLALWRHARKGGFREV